jgi:predicted CoA-binding protein
MNSFEIKQMQERLEQQDENIWFMEGYYEQKKQSAEAAGNKEAAEAYAEICTMIEHVKDDESLKKIYNKRGGTCTATQRQL